MARIMIIEDDLPLAIAYQKKFTQAGYSVVRAEDATTGINRARQEKPDLVILDIMLPGKRNGFDVLRELKLQEATKSIPVIVMTNLAEEGESALALGAKEYLLKVNVSLQELLEKVKTYLAQNQGSPVATG